MTGTPVAFSNVMTTTHAKVVVGFDLTHSGRAALYRAIALANRAPSNVLHFVCVIDPHRGLTAVPPTGAVDYEYAERVQKAVTDDIAAELAAVTVTNRVHFFVHARIGKPAEEILEVAREVGADLIIVGTKGLTGVERAMVGSAAERIVREAHCSVEVARPKTYEYVELLEIVDSTQEHHPYVPPHRYVYEDRNVSLRPLEWPLY